MYQSVLAVGSTIDLKPIVGSPSGSGFLSKEQLIPIQNIGNHSHHCNPNSVNSIVKHLFQQKSASIRNNFLECTLCLNEHNITLKRRIFLFREAIANKTLEFPVFAGDFESEIKEVTELIFPLVKYIPFTSFEFHFVSDGSLFIEFRIDKSDVVYLDIDLTKDEEDYYFSSASRNFQRNKDWSTLGNLDDVLNKLLSYTKEQYSKHQLIAYFI